MKTKRELLEDFKLLIADADGKIYEDAFQDGVRYIILRGPCSLCAYVGVPAGHPLAGNSYDDLPLSVHGGLTFAREGKAGTSWPEGYFWYGWDYGHCDDVSFYDIRHGQLWDGESTPWTVEAVKGEMWSAVYYLKKLMTIAEKAQRVASTSTVADGRPPKADTAPRWAKRI